MAKKQKIEEDTPPPVVYEQEPEVERLEPRAVKNPLGVNEDDGTWEND